MGWIPGRTTAGGEQEFVAVLAHRAVVEEYEQACTAAGAHAGLVDLLSFSLIDAAVAYGDADATADWLLVHVGGGSTTLAVVRDRHPLLFRTVVERAAAGRPRAPDGDVLRGQARGRWALPRSDCRQWREAARRRGRQADDRGPAHDCSRADCEAARTAAAGTGRARCGRARRCGGAPRTAPAEVCDGTASEWGAENESGDTAVLQRTGRPPRSGGARSRDRCDPGVGGRAFRGAVAGVRRTDAGGRDGRERSCRRFDPHEPTRARDTRGRNGRSGRRGGRGQPADRAAAVFLDGFLQRHRADAAGGCDAHGGASRRGRRGDKRRSGRDRGAPSPRSRTSSDDSKRPASWPTCWPARAS